MLKTFPKHLIFCFAFSNSVLAGGSQSKAADFLDENKEVIEFSFSVSESSSASIPITDSRIVAVSRSGKVTLGIAKVLLENRENIRILENISKLDNEEEIYRYAEDALNELSEDMLSLLFTQFNLNNTYRSTALSISECTFKVCAMTYCSYRRLKSLLDQYKNLSRNASFKNAVSQPEFWHQ